MNMIRLWNSLFKDHQTYLKYARHMGRSQDKLIKITTFNKFMFPEKTQSKEDGMQSRFTDDIHSRCSIEFTLAFSKYKRCKG